MRNVGDRVGAILSSKDDTVYFIGYGTYVGRQMPPDEIREHSLTRGVTLEQLKTEYGMSQEDAELALSNPKIDLDDGGFVFGCECWWGDAEAVKDHLAKFANVIKVDMEEERKNRGNRVDGE